MSFLELAFHQNQFFLHDFTFDFRNFDKFWDHVDL
jgi:hypothetical protein